MNRGQVYVDRDPAEEPDEKHQGRNKNHFGPHRVTSKYNGLLCVIECCIPEKQASR